MVLLKVKEILDNQYWCRVRLYGMPYTMKNHHIIFFLFTVPCAGVIIKLLPLAVRISSFNIFCAQKGKIPSSEQSRGLRVEKKNINLTMRNHATTFDLCVSMSYHYIFISSCTVLSRRSRRRWYNSMCTGNDMDEEAHVQRCFGEGRWTKPRQKKEKDQSRTKKR